MADSLKIKFEGMQEFKGLLDQIKDDFGEKDAQKILNNAVKIAMQPVLTTAKNLAPKDTGALMASLRIETRKPNTKDKRSIYVNSTDVVIGTVTTAPGNVLAKKSFTNLKSNKKQKGITSDARAIANEFGTGKIAGRPFMRPAMESNTSQVVGSLVNSLKIALEKYKSRYNK
jgi:HK97 gp10 family phage protein